VKKGEKHPSQDPKRIRVAIDTCGSTIEEAEAAHAKIRARPWLAERFPLGPRAFLAAVGSLDAPRADAAPRATPREPRSPRRSSSTRGSPDGDDPPPRPRDVARNGGGRLGYLERLGLRLRIDEAVRRQVEGWMPGDVRQCRVCLLELPLAEFDGRRVCRACHSARVLERYRARRAAA